MGDCDTLVAADKLVQCATCVRCELTRYMYTLCSELAKMGQYVCCDQVSQSHLTNSDLQTLHIF